MSVVIIGAGHAAGQAAASLCQLKYEGAVTLIGAEPHIPYQRPPLSKQYLSGEWGLERVHIRGASFFEQHSINLQLGTEVVSVDVDKKQVTYDSGEQVDWDHLVFATGSECRSLDVPGVHLQGIHLLRTIEDSSAIRDDMQSASSVVIVGGGYIGLEVASVCARSKLKTTILEIEDRLLARVAVPELSHFYSTLHESHGVEIRTACAATEFVEADGSGRVGSVKCSDGTVIDADLVVIGVGIQPQTSLAESSGLKCDNGIWVDEYCRTESSDVFAIGDCTNHINLAMDERTRLESVPNAVEQARVVAASIAGSAVPYKTPPWFWSDQYDVKLQKVGVSRPDDDQVVRGSTAEQKFAVFYVSRGLIVGADAVNSPREFLVAKQLIGKPADSQALANPDVDLKSLLSAG